MINLPYCVYLLFRDRLEKQRKYKRDFARLSRQKNPGRDAAWMARWREKNPKRNAEIFTRYNQKKGAAAQKKYRQAHPDRRRKSDVINKRRRYARDPLYRATMSLRCRIRQALAGINKSAKTLELLSCNAVQLRNHLEKQFQPGMTWKNYGLRGWHVDHIKPCAKFDLTDPAQQRKCFHYTNLQPLWAIDNIKKGDR